MPSPEPPDINWGVVAEKFLPPRFVEFLNGWGTSALPQLGLLTLSAPLHFRPVRQPLAFGLCAPFLVFSSYLSVAGFPSSAAGYSSLWSAMYLLLSATGRGRLYGVRHPVAWGRDAFSPRALVRRAARGVASVNVITGSYVWMTADRKAESQARRERDRWGVYRAAGEESRSDGSGDDKK